MEILKRKDEQGTQQRCSICKQWKDVDTELVKAKNIKSGHTNYCKDCHRNRLNKSVGRPPKEVEKWNPFVLINDMRFDINLKAISRYNSDRIKLLRNEQGGII